MEFNRKTPYFATLSERKLLSGPGSTKKTYHISLKINSKELDYHPGDSIGVIPLNDTSLIEKTLDVLNISKTDKNHIETLQKVNICTGTKKLIEDIARKNQSKELETLLKNKEALKEYFNSNHVWEILKSYPTSFSIDEFASLLKPMLPRFYSIASSNKAVENEIHLLVADNTYLLKGEIFHGIGSNYLCNLSNINDKIAIYVQKSPHFKLPDLPETPIIMIGPGTGVAPFKAFLQERTALCSSTKNWLFFGERNKNHDYYYQRYLEDLKSNNNLDLDLAFSRDQANKIYVQDLILEKGQKFFSWIQNNATIYVCGDAKQMAKSVEKAILDVFQKHGQMTEEESKAFLKELRRSKRYLCDVY